MATPVYPAPWQAAALASLLALIFFLTACSEGDSKARADASKAPPPVPVIAGTAAVKTVPFQLTAVGTVQPYLSVAVKARIDGQLDQVHFKEGDSVRQGQRLFSLDPRPLQAQLAQAEANLAKDRALLANAARQSKRYADLRDRNFVSREAYNQIRTNEDTAQASVEADVAAVRNARVQVTYARIDSPIDGVAGRVLIQQGNMVKANDTNALVVINQVSPIYVEFSLPEQQLDETRQALARGPVTVQVAPQAGAGPRTEGTLTFIDNTVDATTGMIRMHATVANKERTLWPGQFADVTVLLGEQRDALVVPPQAVQSGPEGSFVYVIKPDSSVEVRKVQPGRTIDGNTVIAKGLAAGERVVVDGQSRLSPGAHVKPQDKLTEGGK